MTTLRLITIVKVEWKNSFKFNHRIKCQLHGKNEGLQKKGKVNFSISFENPDFPNKVVTVYRILLFHI